MATIENIKLALSFIGESDIHPDHPATTEVDEFTQSVNQAKSLIQHVDTGATNSARETEALAVVDEFVTLVKDAKDPKSIAAARAILTKKTEAAPAEKPAVASDVDLEVQNSSFELAYFGEGSVAAGLTRNYIADKYYTFGPNYSAGLAAGIVSFGTAAEVSLYPLHGLNKSLDDVVITLGAGGFFSVSGDQLLEDGGGQAYAGITPFTLKTEEYGFYPKLVLAGTWGFNSGKIIGAVGLAAGIAF